MTPIRFYLTAGTHVGCVRTNNEDNFVLNPDVGQQNWFLPQDSMKPIELGEYGCVMVVADGMGGANCGEVASAIAIEEIRHLFNEADMESVLSSDSGIENFICNVIVEADSAIKHRAKEDEATRGMGTTVVIVWMVDGNVHLAWCGDSRAYVFNKKTGLVQLSHDHSYVQSLVDDGIITPEETFGHPQSNIITRCLGDFETVAQPDYRIYTPEKGDTILLCSDGLCAYCTDATIAEIMEQNDGDVVSLRNILVQSALDVGGYDNVTVAVMNIDIDLPIPSQVDIQALNTELNSIQSEAEITQTEKGEVMKVTKSKVSRRRGREFLFYIKRLLKGKK